MNLEKNKTLIQDFSAYKPSWRYAPEWANYLTKDEDGTWCWWSVEPKIDDNGQWHTIQSKWSICHEDFTWINSKEKRPKNLVEF